MPSANLSASGGTLTATAGGTTKHILLQPSAGGSVGIDLTDPTFGGLQASPGLSIGGYGTPLVIGNTTSTVNFKIGLNNTGQWALYDYGAGSWTLGIFQSGGAIGLGGAPGAGNTIDVFGAGTVNVGSGYKVGNVAGLTIVKTIRNSANTGTCTMTFRGGILTASTC